MKTGKHATAFTHRKKLVKARARETLEGGGAAVLTPVHNGSKAVDERRTCRRRRLQETPATGRSAAARSFPTSFGPLKFCSISKKGRGNLIKKNGTGQPAGIVHTKLR